MGSPLRRVLSQREVGLQPHAPWNAFIDLIATTPLASLSATQRLAALGFLYDSEVQNGGHLQYFENHGHELVSETVAALVSLGGSVQAQVLAEAASVWKSRLRFPIETSAKFVEVAFDGEFDDSDTRYHGCRPTTLELLERFFEAKRDEFVEVRPDV